MSWKSEVVSADNPCDGAMKNLGTPYALEKLWILSAAAASVIRFFQAVDPGYDLGWQLQAAHNLVVGRGLTTFSELSPNLSNPNILTPLTYWPAGYSLAAAGLMSTGASIATTMKILGAAATMLGWWGWARLARVFMGAAVARPFWKSLAIVIAVSTPLLFTQPWGGTDIFLWAIVPWVIECVVRASQEKTPFAWKFDWLAGTLCAFASLMRYASLFVAVYLGCVILWQSQLRLRQSFVRIIAFGIGLLPALMIQGYLNYLIPHQSPVFPGGLFMPHGSVLSRLAAGIPSLRNANYLWAFWIPGRIAGPLFPLRGDASPLLLGLLIAAFALLLTAFNVYRRTSDVTARDSRIVALGLFPAIPLFLWGCMTLSLTNYLGDLRYFWPLIPLSVLVAYSIGSIDGVTRQRRIHGVVRPIATLYVCGYVAVCVLDGLFLFMPGPIGTGQREKLMAGPVERWPSMAVTHEYSAGRRFVLERLRDDPEAVLVTSKAAAFFWDPAVDGSRVRQVYCGGPTPRYFEGPVRLLIYTFDKGEENEVWRYVGNSTLGYIGSRATCFERLAHRRMLRRFPDEGMKLLEASIEPGERISLN